VNILHRMEDLLVAGIRRARPHVMKGLAAAGRGLDAVSRDSKPVRDRIVNAVRPYAEKMLRLLRRYSAVAFRWTFVHVVDLCRRSRPWLERQWQKARPVLLRAWVRVKPVLVRFWVWSAPYRAHLLVLAKSLTNRVIQFGDLTDAERELMHQQIGQEEPEHLLRTRTRVDVGMWFRNGRIWVCRMADSLVLFAHGRRSWRTRIPHTGLLRSRYNHVTGELLLAPRAERRVDSLRMPPLEGLAVLKQIYKNEVPETENWDD